MPLTIFFVGIFQYLWIYQKPRVLFNQVSSHYRHGRREIPPGRGRDCLRETEIGVLEERELKAVVLTDGYQRSCGIKALERIEGLTPWTTNWVCMPYIREKEESKEVNESVRKLFVLLDSSPNLGVFERASWVLSM